MACVLPTHYFHVVFTLPHEIAALALQNRKTIFDLLFSAAAHTLLELGNDEQRLGAQLGVTSVLHTWTRDLRFHPHVHCIVTGGGLAPDGDRWISSRQKYLFPVRVLSDLFRGKFLDGLADVYERGELNLEGACAVLANPDGFTQLKDTLYRKSWVVYAKRPFAGLDPSRSSSISAGTPIAWAFQTTGSFRSTSTAFAFAPRTASRSPSARRSSSGASYSMSCPPASSRFATTACTRAATSARSSQRPGITWRATTNPSKRVCRTGRGGSASSR
jgi:hypothetical protein